MYKAAADVKANGTLSGETTHYYHFVYLLSRRGDSVVDNRLGY